MDEIFREKQSTDCKLRAKQVMENNINDKKGGNYRRRDGVVRNAVD
jgi:hypothetical protein